MTRQDFLHKWFIYGLGLGLVWLLDGLILPRYPVYGVTPMLLPAALVSVAVLEGAYAGTGFGMAVGLLWELAYPGGFGGLVFALALAGMVIGGLSQYALSQSLAGCMLCSTAVLALLDGLRMLRAMLNFDLAAAELLPIVLPECLLSLAWTPLVYGLFRFIFNRVGGTKLA